MDLIHGGDVTGYELRYGRPPLDFSASLNPLGMPPTVARAARRAIDASVPYPDPLCRELTDALARHLAVPAEHIFCGNGAADVIFRLVLAAKPKRALVPAPSFAEYSAALDFVGCETEYFELDPMDEYRIDEGFLSAIHPDLDMVFICQPNNPTGHLMSPELLRDILAKCVMCGAMLVVDECFCGLVREPERHSLLRESAAHPRLFILDSFTKLYGMAGIRLGYGICSNPEVIGALHRAGQPWAVSTVAQEAGLAALTETKYLTDSLGLIHREREWLAGELKRAGMRLVGGEANFLFFYTDDVRLARKLADRGILIRDCGNFRGLVRGYYRVAVRTRNENERLIRALEDAAREK